MAAPSTLVFRPQKDKDTKEVIEGKFVVFGPVEFLEEGKIALVTTKSGGDKEVLITKVRGSFDVEGTPCAYAEFAWPEETR